jgi:hypothetical protein
MYIQLLNNIKYALAVLQPLIDINIYNAQDIIVICYWHDSAFYISQNFASFIAHCSAYRT